MIKLTIDTTGFWRKGAGPGEALIRRNLGSMPGGEDMVKVSISKSQMMSLISDALDQNGVVEIKFEDIEITTRGG